MARAKAPTKVTGGGGYTFADKVAAAFLAQMLKRAFPVEPEFGPIAELRFEARDTGQILDDLRLAQNSKPASRENRPRIAGAKGLERA